MTLRASTLGPVVYALLRYGLGGAFVLAGVLKFMDLPALAETIRAFGLLPPLAADVTALLLPPAEIVAGGLLMADVRGGLPAITIMLLVFTGVLGYALHLGLDVDCGCYGPADPEAEAFSSLWTSLYRDLVMLGAAFGCVVLRRLLRRKPTAFTAIMPGPLVRRIHKHKNSQCIQSQGDAS